MTHTAGFAYDMWNGDMVKYLEKTGTPGVTTCKNAALKTPIMSDPGTRWEYGTNIDFVGKAIEAVSGKRLDAYLRDHMFTPLGMTDTGFKIGDAQRKRLVACMRGARTDLLRRSLRARAGPGIPHGWRRPLWHRRRLHQFTQMILNKGRGNGNQVLKPETVAMMGQNHIGDINMTKMTSAVAFATNDVDLYPGMEKKWGLSFLINTAKTPEGRSPGSLAWAGLANTYYWIDPSRDVAGVILMQVLPFADKKCLEAFAGFETGVYAGLDATGKRRRNGNLVMPGLVRASTSSLMALQSRKTWMAGFEPGHDDLTLKWRAFHSGSYTGSPFFCANSFSEVCGRAPICWITSAAASAPSRPAFSWPAPRTRPNRNPAANRSPAPVVSTILLDRKCRHRGHAFFRRHHAALFAARHNPEFGVAAQLLQRRVEIRGLVQRTQFGLVGEDQVDRAISHQVEKFAAIAVHAK